MKIDKEDACLERLMKETEVEVSLSLPQAKDFYKKLLIKKDSI
jgi:hypothetical protein